MEELEQLKQRLEAIEKSDRLQAEKITLIQRMQTFCLFGVCIGWLLSSNVISDPTNRSALERVGIGVIAASISGMGGSIFLEGKKDG